jgi:oligogalacturonide lyase
MLPDERSMLFLDGQTLLQSGVNGSRERTVFEIPEGERCDGRVRVSDSGQDAVLTVSDGVRWRCLSIELRRGKLSTVVESGVEISHPQPRPGRRSIAYQTDGALWVKDYSSKNGRKVPSPPGAIGPTVWSADGRSLLYLLFPSEKGRLNELREYYADSRQDRLVARTTQYVDFSPNADTSVFVGASGSRVTPYVVLMLRAGGRELTICEHKASEASKVNPVFSPDSRRIFFQSDRDGKPAIYSMVVDDLVEATERTSG